MIAVIDYGVGNLFSISSSLDFIGIENVITNRADVLKKADKIILPGVGAFEDAMNKLKATGLIPALNKEVASGKPLLGICLGMQLLFDVSYEYGEHKGLSYINGKVKSLKKAFEDAQLNLKVPHMGWNSLIFQNSSCPLLKNIKEGEYVYFVHSFYAAECCESVAAFSRYGIDVSAIVQKNNVFGTQFHPEKSGRIGLNILKNFCSL